jgi:heterodisulfide reductase subunit B
MMFTYYPGCSLHGTAREFGESLQGICKALEVELHELEDWNCCGASSGHALNEKLSIALAARNLIIAERDERDILVPCAACYHRMKVAHKALQQGFDRTMGEHYSGRNHVVLAMDLFSDRDILARIAERVVKPLKDLRVVCYYGCLTVRPPDLTEVKDHEYPQHMERLMGQLGAEPLPWSYKTDCCGGGLSLSRPEATDQLIRTLCERALEAGAEAFVVGCPLCQVNIEARQAEIVREMRKGFSLPAFYFTELIGLALGIKGAEGWLKRHMVDPIFLLRSKGLL